MQGTMIMLNIWSGDRDDRFWKDASTFDPNRFLSADGNLINTDKIMAFGYGIDFNYWTKYFHSL
jgi:cytochrome P450